MRNWKGEKNLITPKAVSKKVGKEAILTRTVAKVVETAYKLKGKFSTPIDLRELERELRKGEAILEYLHSHDDVSLRILPYYVSKVIRKLVEEQKGDVEEIIKTLTHLGEIDIAFAVEFAYDYDIDEVFEELYKKYRKDAPLVISTAHRVKGLEFDSVNIKNDFPSPTEVVIDYLLDQKESVKDIRETDIEQTFKAIENDDESVRAILDEINLAYVAITRARREIRGRGFHKFKTAFRKKPNPKGIRRLFNTFENLFQIFIEEKKKYGENYF